MARERIKLGISCIGTDCDNDLHCFRSTKDMVAEGSKGACRKCGIRLIDWERLHDRDPSDIDHTFQQLKHEFVRHCFWHQDLSPRAINHAKRKGKLGLRVAVHKRLKRFIAPETPWNDGRQTPMIENDDTALPYGQHATATCCRTCLEYWHGIPKGVELSEEQLSYCTELVCMYIEDRIPELTEEGEYIPSMRDATV